MNKTSRIMETIKEPLVWIDCEMTGLDIQKDHLLEIAVIITDGNLNIVDDAHSGLTQRVFDSEITVQEAEKQVFEFLKKHVPPGIAPVAGNSVHEDKKYLRKYMPSVADHLHYRIVESMYSTKPINKVCILKSAGKTWVKSITGSMYCVDYEKGHIYIANILFENETEFSEWYDHNPFCYATWTWQTRNYSKKVVPPGAILNSKDLKCTDFKRCNHHEKKPASPPAPVLQNEENRVVKRRKTMSIEFGCKANLKIKCFNDDFFEVWRHNNHTPENIAELSESCLPKAAKQWTQEYVDKHINWKGIKNLLTLMDNRRSASPFKDKEILLQKLKQLNSIADSYNGLRNQTCFLMFTGQNNRDLRIGSGICCSHIHIEGDVVQSIIGSSSTTLKIRVLLFAPSKFTI
ncbi:hypothetical protein [Parasitella parasitica]|uniref:Exonuclease domain-containing protein n=1 Tax=Parasitella parasitica TaxID=35722 RepID=A0A0B7N9F7_9FUNG|nr:hypothetical protein [Parasitella parasitica]